MTDARLNKKTGMAVLAALSLFFMIWVSFVYFTSERASERAVICDAGAYLEAENLPLFIAPEYMQAVYVQGLKKPSAKADSYGCADVTEENPLRIKSMRFFPEAFLSKNILLDDTPFKTILPIKLHAVPTDMQGKTGEFTCNDAGQCVAIVVKGDVFFLLELSESYFASSLQKNIFYATLQRFIEDLVVSSAENSAE
jgi:hypothetical protein